MLGDLAFSVIVVNGDIRFDILGEIFSGVDLVDNQAPRTKLVSGLSEEVKAVDDEVKLGDDGPLPKVIGEEVNVVVGAGHLHLEMPKRFRARF